MAVDDFGGKVLDAVLPLLNPHSRVPVCGLVSQYNATGLPAGPDRMNWLMGQILRKKLAAAGADVSLRTLRGLGYLAS